MTEIIHPYADHSRKTDRFAYVYPVISRRAAGLSLGVNLNPDGGCNYKCAYCQVPRHVLDRKAVKPEVEKVLAELDALYEMVVSGEIWSAPPFQATEQCLRVIRDISISGDGEPSTHPDFAELLPELLLRARRWNLSLQVISNGKGLQRDAVRHSLAAFKPGRDRVWLKADSWCDEDVKNIYRLSVPYAKIYKKMELIMASCPCWLQICLFRRDGQTLSRVPAAEIGKQISAWQKQFPLLEMVQAYTLARQSWVEGVEALTDEELLAWAEEFRSACDLPLQMCGERGLLA